MDKKDRKEGPLFLAPFVNAPSFSQYRIFEPYVEKQIQRYEVPPDESQSLTSDLFDFDPEIHLVGHKPGDLVLKLGDQQYLIICHPGRGNTSYDPGNGEEPLIPIPISPQVHLTLICILLRWKT